MSATKKANDEEKVREVLRELREKNINLENDIMRLEEVLQLPSFSEITGKLYSLSPRPSLCTEKEMTKKVDRCRQLLEPKLGNHLRNNQKLLFIAADLTKCHPKVILHRGHSNSVDTNGNRLLAIPFPAFIVVGPKDISKRQKSSLRIADCIVSVNYNLVSDIIDASISSPSSPTTSSYSLLENLPLKHFIKLLESEKFAVFGVIRDSLNVEEMALTGDWTQIQVVHLPNEPAVGLGFGIVGGASTGVVVKTILPGSAADKDQRLKPGDRILQIGRINVQGMSSQQVAGLLRQSEQVIEVIVGRPINVTDTAEDSLSCWTMATRAALTPSSLEEQIQQRISAMQNGKLRRDSHSRANQQMSSGNQDDDDDDSNNNNAEENIPQPSTSAEIFHDDVNNPSGHDNKKLLRRSQSSEKRPGSSDSHASKAKSISHSNSDRPISLKNLQEMALTTFCRENWIEGSYEEVNVELQRDSHGLGITVAGYVHKKEEITGVFVKSLVPNSAAHLSNKIRVHDLIISVNGNSLENLTHSQCVKALIKSGNRVRLKMIRFSTDSPQAICLKMLHEQETDTQIADVQSTLLDYKHSWQTKLGADYEVISVVIHPDKNDIDGGLGISFDGTVDITDDGTQLCPHHYVESLRKNGPAAKCGMLKAGDELLQVNDQVLYGESHVTVRYALSKSSGNEQKDVRLFFCRKAQQINLYMPSPEQSLPLAYTLLASDGIERIVKAKSESSINLSKQNGGYFLNEVAKKLKSRSLEHLSGLAIWNCVPIVVTLEKDSRGLGFSVIDYQDPMHGGESVIVIRSLVPGGIAQADGRIVPGDRLLFVNSTDLSNASLEQAVAVLKATPAGLVRLGIAKPVPVDQLHFGTHSPIISRSERLLAKGTSPRSRRRRPNLCAAGISGASSAEEVWIGADLYRKLNTQLYFPSSESGSPTTPRSHSSMLTWSPCSSRSLSPCGTPTLQGTWGYDVIFLPKNLERSIKLIKGSLPIGIVLEAEVDKGINGCVVKSICSKKAIGRDGRVQVGDYLVKINTESLRNVTNAQARAILKRTNLIGTQCNVVYITSADARLWKQRFHREAESSEIAPIVNRLSPKVFPKFYKSPYLGRKITPNGGEAASAPTTADISSSSAIPGAAAHLFSDSSFVDDDIYSKKKVIKEEEEGMHEQSILHHSIDETTMNVAEKFAKERTASIIDGILIGEFANDLVKAALEETFLELSISTQFCDWHHNRGTSSEPQEPFSRTPLPSPSDEKTPQFLNYSNAKNLLEKSSSIEKNFNSPILNESTTMPYESEPGPSTSSSTAMTSLPSTSDANKKPAITVSETVEKITLTSLGAAATPSTSSATSEPNNSSSSKKKRNNFWGEARTVLLFREPNESFGISIVGGRVEVSHKGGLPGTGNTVCGIFIKSVLPESPAGKSGKMFMGDRVISVNDTDLKDATHEYAVQVIKSATNPVKFVVQSLQSFSVHHQQQQQQPTQSSSEIPKPQKIEIIHEKPIFKKEEEEKHVRMAETPLEEIKETLQKDDSGVDSSHKTVSSAPSTSSRESQKQRRLSKLRESMKKKLDSESAAALPKSDDDPEEEDRFCYTLDKIKRKYGNLPGEPIIIRLENIPPKGLGLSLAGNRDRHKTSVFVVDIKSTSPLPLHVGDELLEINGKVLFGLSHVTATTKIRECCEGDQLALLILRRGDAVEDMATTSSSSTKVDSAEPPEVEETPPSPTSSPILEIPAKTGDDSSGGTSTTGTPDGHATASALSAGASSTLPSPSQTDGARKKSYQMEKTVPIETGKETLIEIDKDGRGLGISIVGGSDTVLGTVVIHEVYQEGAASHDGRLKPGDQVLEVNGFSLRSVSHEQAISLLRKTPAKVRMLIYRDINLHQSLLDPTQIYNMFTIELSKKPGRGLGISIVGRKNEPGVYCSEIVKGGLAEQDGRLMQGDQILAVNTQDVTNSMQEDVATMLKTCTGKITLKIGRWKLTETANRVHAAQPPSLSPRLGRNENTSTGGPTPTTPRTMEEKNGPTPENGILLEEKRDVPPPAPSSWPTTIPPEVTIQDENQVIVHPDLSPVTEETVSQHDLKSLTNDSEPPPTPTPMREIALNSEWHEEGSEDVLISLKKVDGEQWGMGIGKRARGILITSLQPGSTAAEKLKVGDRILGVNGEKIADQHSAVTLIKASVNCVILQVGRPIIRPNSDNL